MTAPRSAKQPAKRPACDHEADRPDLDEYFNEFGNFGPDITVEDRIKMCRAYASYLASTLPPKPKLASKKRK